MKNKLICIIACLMIGALALTGCNKDVKLKSTKIEVQTKETSDVGVSVNEPKEETTTARTVIVETETTTEEETTNDNINSNSNNNNGADTGDADISDGDIRRVEEIARDAINGVYGNGKDREIALGERYAEVQNWIDANYEPPAKAYVEPDYEDSYSYEDTYSYGHSYPSGDGVLTPTSGINYYGGVLETYYDLDMSWCISVMRGMGFDEVNYPYWIRSDGCKMLGDYIMVAADFGWEPRGTFTWTSLGAAIVVDTGGGGWYWHDICVQGW